jgi:hypothetical protein
MSNRRLFVGELAPVLAPAVELELELIQTHTTQKLLLWVEVGANAVRRRSERYAHSAPAVGSEGNLKLFHIGGAA